MLQTIQRQLGIFAAFVEELEQYDGELKVFLYLPSYDYDKPLPYCSEFRNVREKVCGLYRLARSPSTGNDQNTYHLQGSQDKQQETADSLCGQRFYWGSVYQSKRIPRRNL